MSAREAAARAAVLKTIYDQVRDAYNSARGTVTTQLDPGDRKHAVLDDGTDIGTVSYTRGRITARVHDEAAFLASVREHRPDEIVETVRSSFRDRVLKVAAAEGAYVVNDDGVVIDGVAVSAGEPYVSVRQTEDQKQAVVEAHAAGRLAALLHGTPLAALEEDDQ